MGMWTLGWDHDKLTKLKLKWNQSTQNKKNIRHTFKFVPLGLWNVIECKKKVVLGFAMENLGHIP
jgi:hypothetical protein